MMIRSARIGALVALFTAAMIGGCSTTPTSDQVQNQAQESNLMNAARAVPIPAVANYQEKRLLKTIYELRDQENLTTYTYLIAENTGRLRFLGESIGYGIPYSTQYSAPERPAYYGELHYEGDLALPQAEPNGLYPPASADGTWVLMKDPNGRDAHPVYIEPKIIVSPFRLPSD